MSYYVRANIFSFFDKMFLKTMRKKHIFVPQTTAERSVHIASYGSKIGLPEETEDDIVYDARLTFSLE